MRASGFLRRAAVSGAAPAGPHVACLDDVRSVIKLEGATLIDYLQVRARAGCRDRRRRRCRQP